ncbi:hypothetical protein [Mycobacterium sp. UM_CSW]|uniref:hypothetical protein n=1 Tax=Mycobacterium sp. UM_CSW TaxID=1370119 RepID=UPI00137715E3|nr:hypothetical protein [Mycobacterium sp. UM_CSW]
MADWVYEMQVPDDVGDPDELEQYRALAIATWHTAVEASGAMPGEPKTELVKVSPAHARLDPVTGRVPARAWRVTGPGA